MMGDKSCQAGLIGDDSIQSLAQLLEVVAPDNHSVSISLPGYLFSC